MENDLMPIDILLLELSMGEAMKHKGSMHLMSYKKFKRIDDSLNHYLKTGELVMSEYGYVKRSPNGSN